jgi:hypothetical protein
MPEIRERFSAAAAVAWYLGEDRLEVERNRRYQPTRTPCPVYADGNDYLAASSSAGRKPKEADDNRFGYWKWEVASDHHPLGWVIWRAIAARVSLEQRQKIVKKAWDRIESAEPDISTERLMMMVADDTDEDYGDVAALYQGENPDDR